MNLVLLKGNVGHDAKITNFDGGGKVAQFSLATTERGYTKKDGTKVEPTTEWHNVVVRNSGLAGVCEQYVKKGTSLLVQGKIQTREWTGNDGVTKRITEIIASNLELLPGGQKRESAPAPMPDSMPQGEVKYDDMPF